MSKLRWLPIFLLIISTSGCLIHSSRNERRTGNYISDNTFGKIREGKTNQAWILATMGEPDAKEKTGDGGEVWRWSYTETRSSSGYIFLLFGGDSRRTTDGHAFVEFQDGIVTRKWRG